MLCPHCHYYQNRVLETRSNASENAVRRRHACRKCGKAFTSIQRIEVYQEGAWQPVPLAAVPDPQPVAPPAPRPRLKRPDNPAPDRLHPITGAEHWLADIERDGLPPALLEGMLAWWNESRWGKHRTQATWTQLAFTLSAGRVAFLCKQGQHDIARALVEAGIEHGWQALKPEYLRGISAAPPAAASAGDEAAAAIRDMLKRADAA
ncbi:hypothetical protein LBMAG41_13470 [Cyanobium sp.]|nr:hypothetical protein LBMAG41_13470 [Cyanobium sp.]